MKKLVLIAALLLLVSCVKEESREEREVGMSYNNGRINAPVDATDPYFVLGVAPVYVNGRPVYDVAHICTHPNINSWSTVKPVTNTEMSYRDSGSPGAYVKHPFENFNYNFLWWVGVPKITTMNDSGLVWDAIEFCGHKAPCIQYVTLDEGFITNIVNTMNARAGFMWPVSPLVAPYRLSDFNGYNHTAIPAFFINVPDIVYIGSGGRLWYKFNDLYSSDYGVSLFATALFDNFYPCVVVVNSRGGIVGMHASDQTILELPSYTFNTLSADTYTVYKGIYNPHVKRFIPLPNLPQFGRDYINPASVVVRAGSDVSLNNFANGNLVLEILSISPGIAYATTYSGVTRSMDFAPYFYTFDNVVSYPGNNGKDRGSWCVVSKDQYFNDRGVLFSVNIWNNKKDTGHGTNSIVASLNKFSFEYRYTGAPSVHKITPTYYRWSNYANGSVIQYNTNDNIVIPEGGDVNLLIQLNITGIDNSMDIFTGELHMFYEGDHVGKILDSNRFYMGRDDATEALVSIEKGTGIAYGSEWDTNGWVQLNIRSESRIEGYWDNYSEVWKR